MRCTVKDIVKKPVIWLPAIISSAIPGPVSTMVFKMTDNATGAGMGTAGLVGQINTYQDMVAGGTSSTVVLIEIAVMHFILPGLIAWIVAKIMRSKGIIKDGDMKLSL